MVPARHRLRARRRPIRCRPHQRLGRDHPPLGPTPLHPARGPNPDPRPRIRTLARSDLRCRTPGAHSRPTSLEIEALDRGLREIALCLTRIVLLHYAPTEETIAGEQHGIWAFLGTDRLAAPIAEHEPDLLLQGHAHSGTFSGKIGEVPVYNVSVPVIGRDFWLFELDVSAPARTPIH